MKCYGLLLMLLFSASSAADISVMGGYQFGGSFEDEVSGKNYDTKSSPMYLVSLDFQAEETRHNRDTLYVGGFFSWQDTEVQDTPRQVDLTVNYLHLTATKQWNQGRFKTFGIGGAGVTRMDFKDESTYDKFSISIGGGGFYELAKNLDLRFEGRLYGTFFNSSSLVACGASCTVRIKADFWIQAGLNAGLTYRF